MSRGLYTGFSPFYLGSCKLFGSQKFFRISNTMRRAEEIKLEKNGTIALFLNFFLV